MREKIGFDLDWKFSLANADLLKPYEDWLGVPNFRSGPPAKKFDDSNWRLLDLPHDFVVESGFIPPADLPDCDSPDLHVQHGSHRTGVAWYRKQFNLPVEDAGKRIYLYFDGVFRDSRVYLNEFYVGSHASGYSSFYFDITDFLAFGDENVLAVRVDATRPEGWFYEGGGIYRHVWLVKTAPLHVAPWGTFITSDLDFTTVKPSALVSVRTRVANRSAESAAATLVTELSGPDGTRLRRVSAVVMAAWEEKEFTTSIPLAGPRLWSLEDPALYTVTTKIERNGNLLDLYETTTGLRAISFDPDQGFLLNQMAVKLKGVCCHQDHAGVGAAVPNHVQEYRIRRLMEMGCNAYRCSHNPPAPEILELCDRLGILVMVEKRRLSSADEELAELEAIIRRDRNHPCVIFWAMGNEETGVQWTENGRRMARRISDFIHILDPSRPTTLAVCFWDPVIQAEEPLEREPLVNQELDVMGFNYAVDHWEGYHAKHPQQPIVISEASTDLRTRGCNASDDAGCQLAWGDPRGQHRAELQWDKVARYPYLSGIFLWTGFDYRGEPTPFGWPAVISNFGLMDLCGFPKDHYYYYQAAWKNEPLVHLFPHWTWPEKVGQSMQVTGYTNCEEVELFVNGYSQGRRTVQPNYHVVWPGVIYESGVLEAKGYRTGQVVATARVETSGRPYALRLWRSRDWLRSDRQDACVVNISVVDEQDRLVPEACNLVRFDVSGSGRVIGTGSGDPASHEEEPGSRRRAFHGLCQAILLSGAETGTLTLTVSANGVLPARMELEIR